MVTADPVFLGATRVTAGPECQPHLLFRLDQREEDAPDRHDQQTVGQWHGLRPEQDLQGRHTGDGELCGADGDYAGSS